MLNKDCLTCPCWIKKEERCFLIDSAPGAKGGGHLNHHAVGRHTNEELDGLLESIKQAARQKVEDIRARLVEVEQKRLLV